MLEHAETTSFVASPTGAKTFKEDPALSGRVMQYLGCDSSEGIEDLDFFKFAFLTIMRPTGDIVDLGIDEILQSKAASIGYLESIDELVASFGNIDPQLQFNAVRQILEMASKTIYTTFYGDGSTPISLSIADEQEKNFPTYYHQILSEARHFRNILMTARILQTYRSLGKTTRICIVAGMNHWVGEKGILNLYKTLCQKTPLLLGNHGSFHEDDYMSSLPKLGQETMEKLKEDIKNIPPLQED